MIRLIKLWIGVCEIWQESSIPKSIYPLFFKTKIQLAVFSISRIKYFNVFGATLYINIHVRIVMRRMSVNHPDIFIYVSLNTEVYLQELIGLIKTLNSNIYKHFLDTNHAIDSSNFSIIFSANDTSIKVAESIFIHKLSSDNVFHPSSYFRLNVVFCQIGIYMVTGNFPPRKFLPEGSTPVVSRPEHSCHEKYAWKQR